MTKRRRTDEINENDEEPEDTTAFQRALMEFVKNWEINNASSKGKNGFLKTTTNEESPLSYLWKKPTEPGSSNTGGAATHTFSSKNTDTTDDVSASKNPFIGLRGFSKPTTAGESTFSFLRRMPFAAETGNISGAKTDSALCSANMNTKRFKVDNNLKTTSSSKSGNEKSDEYIKKLKNLNESLAAWIMANIVANPFCILTPILEDYANYLKVMDEEEDETKKPFTETIANFFQSTVKPINTVVPSSGFSFSATPGSTSIGGGAAGTISADKPSIFGCAAQSIAQPNAFNFGLNRYQNNSATYPDFGRTNSFFFGSKVEDKSINQESEKPPAKSIVQPNAFNFGLNRYQNNSATYPDFGRANSFSFGNKIEDKSFYLGSGKPPAFSLTPCKPSFNFTTTKPASLLPRKYGKKSTACKVPTSGVATTTCLPRFPKGAFGTSALNYAGNANVSKGTTAFNAQANKTNIFSYGLRTYEKNSSNNPSSSTAESRFFGTKEEEKSSSTPATFGGMQLRSSENEKTEKNQPTKDV